ncbi:MAG: hypothetical protein AAGE89_05625 [Pseudomonadota bacterium]
MVLSRTVLAALFAVGLGMCPNLSLATEDEVARSGQSVATPSDYFLLTIFLKHDQSKTLSQIADELKETGFWAKFPPEGIEIESWYVMMGIGQVVTLQVPPERLREVNRAIELYGWSAFRTEFYPTYDLRATAKKLRARALEAAADQ